MIGVVVPAHDEEQLLGACLASVAVAAAVVPVAVRVVVVADACTDATVAVARAAGADVVELGARCVGAARRAGAQRALTAGATWIASTDADSLVAPDWLAVQVRLAAAGHEAVAGVVEVTDWSGRTADVRAAHLAHYQDRDGHPHVHGACLGLSVRAYRAAGGWSAVPLHEDVALLTGLTAAGIAVTRTNALRVATSARADGRAEGGFGDFLTALGSAVGGGAAA